MNTDTDPRTRPGNDLEPAGSVPCPHCGEPLTPVPTPQVQCPGCGHRAASGFVAEAAWLIRQDALLHARLDWVRAQLLSGSPVPAPVTGPAVARDPAGVGVGARNLLLSVGALLLVVAAAVFAAVIWTRLGAAGQLVALALVVAVLAGGAHGLRRTYRATAETLAYAGAAVAAVAALSAPRLGLGAPWTTEYPARWGMVAMAIVAMLAVVGAWSSQLTAWHVALVVASGAGVVAASFGWATDDVPGPAGVALLAVLAAGLLALPGVLPALPPPFGRDLRAVGRVVGAAAYLLGLGAYGDLEQHLRWAGTWAVVAVATVSGLSSPVARARAAAGRSEAAVLAGVAVGQVLPLALFDRPEPRTAALLALAVVGAAALTLTLRRGLAGAGGAAAVTVWTTTCGLTIATVRGMSQEQLTGYLAAVAAALLLVACAPAVDWPVPLRAGLVPRAARSPLAWGGAALGSLAAWLVADAWTVRLLEAYTLPSAGLLMVAGASTRWLRGRGGSLAVAGPALVVALGPATLVAVQQSLDGEPARRAAAVIVAGTALAVAGVAARWLAPLLAGSAAAVMTALGQLTTLIDLVPRWVSLGVAGVLLVAAGFGYEALMRGGRHAWRAARALR